MMIRMVLAIKMMMVYAYVFDCEKGHDDFIALRVMSSADDEM